MNKKFLIVLLGAAALGLSACGSSDDNSAPATTPTASTSDIPASALASGAALNSYLDGQITSATSDTSEPVVVGDATTVPTDDTTETSL